MYSRIPLKIVKQLYFTTTQDLIQLINFRSMVSSLYPLSPPIFRFKKGGKSKQGCDSQSGSNLGPKAMH